MSRVWTYQRVAPALIVILVVSVLCAQEKKEFKYLVGPRALICITNHYGSITVKPSGNMQVLVTTVSHSAAVRFNNEQHGNRIELQSLSAKHQGVNLVDYTALVPSDAFLSLRSSDGSLSAEGLHGDLILEGGAANVALTDISNAHLHVKTVSGRVALTDIRDSHLDVHSVTGDVTLDSINRSWVEVHSGSGRITYDGDPGRGGEYLLTSHSGSVSVSIPANAAVEIKAHSVRGKSEGLPDITNRDMVRGNLLQQRTVGVSRFRLHSFSGNIQVKRP